jgi:hypothetical protein
MLQSALRALVLVLLVGLPETALAKPSSTSARLFVIERNTNRNIVAYDVRLRPDGALDVGDPLSAYWVLLEQRGQREELSWLERELAYGFEVLPPVSVAGFRLKLVSYDKRAVQVRRSGARYRALLQIAKRPAWLDKIYVRARPGWIHPIVEYIELVGVDAASGERLVERIVAD